MFKFGKKREMIRTTEENEEHKAIKLQKWQRANFAAELGFDPDTKDKEELALIDKRYELMLRSVNAWNEEQRKDLDRILREARGDS
jgi:hypothetical protein